MDKTAILIRFHLTYISYLRHFNLFYLIIIEGGYSSFDIKKKRVYRILICFSLFLFMFPWSSCFHLLHFLNQTLHTLTVLLDFLNYLNEHYQGLKMGEYFCPLPVANISFTFSFNHFLSFSLLSIIFPHFCLLGEEG